MIDQTSLKTFIDSLNDYNLDYFFSSEGKNSPDVAHWNNSVNIYSDVKKLLSDLEAEQHVKRIFHELEVNNNADVGQKLDEIEDFEKDRDFCEKNIIAVNKILDVVLAKKLQKIALERGLTSHPQNLRNILSYFLIKKPELLLIIESLLTIIADHDHFAIEERSRASRVLVNNYRIETLFIYISISSDLTKYQKEFIFSWLTAFQKVYRKIHEILFDKQKDKMNVAKSWFNKTPTELKKGGLILREDHKITIFLREFIDNVLDNKNENLKKIGRSILLTVNNEEVLRRMHKIIGEDKHLSSLPEVVKKIYKEIYLIMNDYRRLCTAQRSSKVYLKNTYSFFSSQIRVAEALILSASKDCKKTPILGEKKEHVLLEATKKNLEESGMRHLFEVWPIPTISQVIFNTICKLKSMIPNEKEYLISHFLYREKLLEFLMRLERVGIGIIKKPDIPLITNAFQLNALGLIRKGVYLGSTGHWNSPNQKPPSVICCTNPNALGNCYGHMLRHMALRVFLATGEFYESPFILDSTQRFGQMDEEDVVDSLLIRPGLFLLDIPQEIADFWRHEQSHQMSSKLDKIIEQRINDERTYA